MPSAEIDSLIQRVIADFAIYYAISGIISCFFGYTFRRVLPFFIGLVFGFVYGFALTIALNNQNGTLIEDINSTLKQFGTIIQKEDWESFKSLGIEYTAKYLVIPIISALVLACLSATFYKFTMALCFSISVFFIVYPYFVEMENRMLYSIICAGVGFVLLYLLYNILYILSTAASGAYLLGIALATTELIKPDYIDAVTIGLFILGAVCQFTQFYGTQRRAKKKKRIECED